MLKIPRTGFMVFVGVVASIISSDSAIAQYEGAVTGKPITHTSNGLPIGIPETVEGYSGEQLLPYNSQEPWMHGYYQPIPAYGGYSAFRPYNYKHVLAQSQAAGGWGMSPTMPYSQQFWHRYHRRAGMKPPISHERFPQRQPLQQPRLQQQSLQQQPSFQQQALNQNSHRARTVPVLENRRSQQPIYGSQTIPQLRFPR